MVNRGLPNALELGQLREAVLKGGLEADPFVCLETRPRVSGLNVAVAWPLPESMRESFERLTTKLAAICPELYVYRYLQTHVTVVTLVNFKSHVDPDPTCREQTAAAAERAARVLQPLSLSWEAFPLEFTSVVLSRQAVFVPIADETGAIARIRNDIVVALARDSLSRQILIPPAVHTTVGRFRRVPGELDGFLKAFDDIARETHLGRTVVREIILTAETKPYMEEGDVLQRLPLANRDR